MYSLEKLNIKAYALSDNTKKHNEILKLLAIIFMVIDHIGALMFTDVEILRMIGRLAFPIFAYQLAQGYRYTSNVNKYMFRLWVFALISQIPFSLAFDTFKLNIMFTFLVSLFLIDKIAKKEYYWLFFVLAIPYFVPIEFSWYGVVLPVVFYLAKDNKAIALALSVALTVLYMVFNHYFIAVYAILGAFIALYFPKHELNIKMNKYFFYWFYPVHLAVLFLIKMILIQLLM